MLGFASFELKFSDKSFILDALQNSVPGTGERSYGKRVDVRSLSLASQLLHKRGAGLSRA